MLPTDSRARAFYFPIKKLNTARAKSEPTKMLQMRKADPKVHAGLPELRSSVLQIVQRRKRMSGGGIEGCSHAPRRLSRT